MAFRIFSVLSISVLIWCPERQVLAAGVCTVWSGDIASVQGKLEIKSADPIEWRAVELGETFEAGESLRLVGPGRAAVVVSDAPVRLFRNAIVTFTGDEGNAPTGLDVHSGDVHILQSQPKGFERVRGFFEEQNEYVVVDPRGTEFGISVEPDQIRAWVFEGRVQVSNQFGSEELASDQVVIAKPGQVPVQQLVIKPRDAVQWAIHYPPLVDYNSAAYGIGPAASTIQEALTHYRQGDLTSAFARLDSVPTDLRDAQYFNLRAGLSLTVGRVVEASADIQQALSIEPNNGTGLALRAVIAVAQNEKDQALSLAQQAVAKSPQSPVPHMALSYAYQANFEIEQALESAQNAVNLAPGNALAWARLSELWLSVGNLDRALEAAKEAETINPDLPRIQTVLGFAYLTQIKIDKAIAAFEKAGSCDQGDPLPHLGLGLAKIRQGDIEKGRRQIEIAAILDPNNALVRSYLGKAYYEEKRNKLAEEQFEMAKALDLNDPTSYFYDAIREQTENRPVEALDNLQKSIELNDNRAVYRSRLLLDQDLAARSASLARTYGDLGFERLALVEGWKSVTTDPASYSSHRFLADSYATLPRHEIARVSELLQSQLLQPINVTPVQPRLAETNLLILDGAGPAAPSFNEFNPLFLRDRSALQASGVVGSNDTFGDELVHSRVQGRTSYSFGQFHYEADGFRQNNDLQSDIYDAFVQYRLTDDVGVQVEVRYAEQERGDLSLRFDDGSQNFSTAFRETQARDSVRLGFHLTQSERSDILGSAIYQSFEFDQRDVQLVDVEIFPGMTIEEPVDISVGREREGYITELQHLFRPEEFIFVTGVSHINQDVQQSLTTQSVFVSSTTEQNDDIRKDSVYVYSVINALDGLSLTAALSANSLEIGTQIDREQVNPKIGGIWQPAPNTTVRMAAFRTLNSTLTFNQTVEPTQIAGFSQVFDDENGTDAWRYGFAVDQKISPRMFAGIEYAERQLEVPRFSSGDTPASFVDWEEQLGRAYFYWAPSSKLALSAEYQNEYLNRDNPLTTGIHNVRTQRTPLGANLFYASGAVVRLKATYLQQSGFFSRNMPDADVFPGQDSFWVFDARLDYRLPKRRGFVSVGGKNIFDKKFGFQDTDLDDPTVTPERFVFAKLTLAY